MSRPSSLGSGLCGRFMVTGPLPRGPSEEEFQPPLGFFFPEVIPFVCIVVMAPVWAARHVHRAEYWRAAAVLAVAIPAGVAFVWFFRKGRRWSAYLTIYGVLLLVFLFPSLIVP